MYPIKPKADFFLAATVVREKTNLNYIHLASMNFNRQYHKPAYLHRQYISQASPVNLGNVILFKLFLLSLSSPL